MKTIFLRSLSIALLLGIFVAGTAPAHGTPTITIQPTVVSPGGQITVTGADMEEGESFKLTLESMNGIVQLGEATAAKNGDEAGFTAIFTLPADLTPGSYFVRCIAEDGDSTSADLTIAASSVQTNPQQMEASAEPLVLARSKSPLLIGSVVVLALINAGLGVGLIRMSK